MIATVLSIQAALAPQSCVAATSAGDCMHVRVGPVCLSVPLLLVQRILRPELAHLCNRSSPILKRRPLPSRHTSAFYRTGNSCAWVHMQAKSAPLSAFARAMPLSKACHLNALCRTMHFGMIQIRPLLFFLHIHLQLKIPRQLTNSLSFLGGWLCCRNQLEGYMPPAAYMRPGRNYPLPPKDVPKGKPNIVFILTDEYVI